MRVAQLGALAEQDLIDIWRHTAEQWGDEQADSYLNAIWHSVELLLSHPEMGARRDTVREGYRVLFVNRRAIYYVISPATIRIVRVLHERMDPYRYMP